MRDKLVVLKEFISTKEILKEHTMNNSFIKHNLETNHNFDFKDSKMLVKHT